MYKQDYAFVIHSRPYRETSALLTLLTAEHGKLTVIAKGVRKTKKSMFCEPFTLSKVQLYGNGELMNLISSDVVKYFDLDKKLHIGLYLNELIYKIVPSYEFNLDIFMYYQKMIEVIVDFSRLPIEINLRLFEKFLLQNMGYALSLTHDSSTGDLIKDDSVYSYGQSNGLIEMDFYKLGFISGGSCIEFNNGIDMKSTYVKNNIQNILKELKFFMRGILNNFTEGKLNTRKYYGVVD